MPARINYRYYPFIATQKEFPNLFIEKPSVLVPGNSVLRDKTIEVFKTIVENGEVPVEAFSDHDESILVYNTILDIVKFIDDKRIANRVALAYAKTASKALNEEKNEVLVAIASKLGLKVKFDASNFPKIPLVVTEQRSVRVLFTTCPFSLPIQEYIMIVTPRLMHDQSYALINHVVTGGRVFLDRNTFKRLLEEHIYYSILLQIERTEPPSTPDFVELVEGVKSTITSYQEKLINKSVFLELEPGRESPDSTEKIVVEELFPPCIKKIVDLINTGGNPSHLERFNLAAFLGYIGLDVDDIIEYFRKTPDFNEKIARYQVEHILGMRGGRKKYKPYNCENLKASNICPISGQCPGGKNPIAVYKYNIRRTLSRKKKRGGDQVEQSEEAAGGI